MGMDDDIAAALPTAPPAAPARRAAAIDLALRRFDGEEEAPVRRPARHTFRYRFAGALVAATLVALVATPVARESMRQRPGVERSRAPPAVVANEPPQATKREPAADSVADEAEDAA